MQLTPEDSLLLLVCRAYLSQQESAHLHRLVTAPQPLNWSYVLWRADHYRMTPLILYHLRALGVVDRVSAAVREYLESWVTLSETRSTAFFKELGMILDAFEDQGIDCFLLKGAALAPLYYPAPLLRPMQDLDIMIHPQDAVAAQAVMRDLGFSHGIYNAGNNQFQEIVHHITPRSLEAHHELPSFTKLTVMPSPLPKTTLPKAWRHKHFKCFIKNEQLTLPVFVDLHTNLSVGMELADVWRGARREEVFGKLVRCQSPTAMLWFICGRLYLEAFQYSTLKLIMFGDAHTILHRRGSEIDWTELLVVARKYAMQAPCYYVLSQLSKTGTVVVPPPLLARLAPDPNGVPLPNDWGDVMPKLLAKTLVHPLQLA